MEVYPVVNNVEGLTQGLYHYLVEEHSLELIREGDLRRDLVRGTRGQGEVGEAGAVLVITAAYPRIQWRYGRRSQRYVFMEAGHIAQNVYLVATSLGMGSCAIGAFADAELNRLVGVDGEEEAVVYLMTLGKI